MADPIGNRDYPNLSGLNLPQALVKAITRAYSLVYDLRDAVVKQNVASKAFNSANQSLANAGAFNKLKFDTNTYTNDALHVAGSTDFIATVPGLYLAHGQLSWAADATGTFRNFEIFLNGVVAGYDVTNPPSAAGTLDQQVAAVLTLKTGDAVQFVAIHDGVGAINTNAIHTFGSLTLLNKTTS